MLIKKRTVTALSDIVLRSAKGHERELRAGQSSEMTDYDWALFGDHCRRSDACLVKIKMVDSEAREEQEEQKQEEIVIEEKPRRKKKSKDVPACDACGLSPCECE